MKSFPLILECEVQTFTYALMTQEIHETIKLQYHIISLCSWVLYASLGLGEW